MDKKNGVALFTVIYPGINNYVNDFNACLEEQTFKGFDLIVVNDNYPRSAKQLFTAINVIELEGKPSIAKNREIGINYAISQGYTSLVLCDIDDVFREDRVEKVVNLLQETDIVVNDLKIIGPDKDVLYPIYFSHSITTDTQIDLDFMLKKNIFGFSNTALNLKGVSKVDFPSELKVVDWYFFTLLIMRGLSVKVLLEPLTGYRQHNNNLIGIDDFSVDLFKKLLTLKMIHFRLLSEIDIFFLTYKKIVELECTVSDEQIRHSILKNKEINPYPLWWENIQIANFN